MIRFGRALTVMLALPMATAALAQQHVMAGQDHAAMEAQPSDSDEETIPQGTAPAPPSDHAAEQFYSRADMEAARRLLRYEGGGMPASLIMIDRFEYRPSRGSNGYHWEGGGFFGGDLDRFAFKTEGEGEEGSALERAEIQALYSRAISPYFNVQAGVRHDIRPKPGRSYAVIGVDGLAPYWFDVGAELFLSDRGDLHARVEASYDQRITQRLILQPQAELNFAAQAVPALGIGSGLSDAELGLRLRYELVREIAPYVGVSWERKFGDTAAFAPVAGARPSSTAIVFGIRAWF